MMQKSQPRVFLLCCSILALIALSAPVLASNNLRPPIVIADAASGCPSVEGAFVVLLDPSRGMLLLSAAPFLGGHPVGDARGGEMTLSLPGFGSWKLDRAGSNVGQVSLWGARYPFLAQSGNGCIGFDKQHWSSEGDLVTYARWLTEEIYLELPVEERQRRPDFRLADREVSFEVQRPGYGTFQLYGKEGSTKACRYEDSQRIYLFMPFVLDEAGNRVAVKVFSTDGSYFDTSDKTSLGWVVASSEEPGELADSSFTIVIKDVVTPGGD